MLKTMPKVDPLRFNSKVIPRNVIKNPNNPFDALAEYHNLFCEDLVVSFNKKILKADMSARELVENVAEQYDLALPQDLNLPLFDLVEEYGWSSCSDIELIYNQGLISADVKYYMEIIFSELENASSPEELSTRIVQIENDLIANEGIDDPEELSAVLTATSTIRYSAVYWESELKGWFPWSAFADALIGALGVLHIVQSGGLASAYVVTFISSATASFGVAIIEGH